MSNKLNIRLFQPDLVWQAANSNLQKLNVMADSLLNVDLLICPEMFTTGFTMAVQNVAQSWPGESVNTLQQIADKSDTAIVCSLVVHDQKKYFNRLVFLKPNVKPEYYDKRHLFTMGEEHHYYSAGDKQLLVEYKGWKIMPLICYDLRFPVWSRNIHDYDLLLYVANWPDSRREVWKTLLKARAIENQCFVAGVNRVGKDGMGLNYSGDSVVIDAKGNKIVNCVDYQECYCDVLIDKLELAAFREKFPVLNDKDSFEILNNHLVKRDSH
ncbi:MAG: amidohydrolase [Bacteroidota bacterium]|nr:amidohydrolase [Bacteroidota bacterium]